MWYTVKVKYNKAVDGDDVKKVAESYLLDAENFTDAETIAHEKLGTVVKGGFNVVSISKANVHDVFTNEDADKWYKCKVTYEDVVDDKTKKISTLYIAAGQTVEEASQLVLDELSDMMVDGLEVRSVVVMPILDIFKKSDTSVKFTVVKSDDDAKVTVEYSL